jgi:hypothetical protein
MTPPRAGRALLVAVRQDPAAPILPITPTIPMNKNTDNRNTADSQSGTDFGPVIYSYTRSQAIADGVQVEVSKVAEEAGIRFPVFLTRAVYDSFVAVPPGVAGQDEAGRLWDVVWMLRFAILANAARIKARPGHGGPCGTHRLPYALYVRNDNHRARLIKLVAVCSALDIDDPQPAITVMLPDED